MPAGSAPVNSPRMSPRLQTDSAKGRLTPGALDKHPHQNTKGNESKGHERCSLSVVLVVVRKHKPPASTPRSLTVNEDSMCNR
jgi:hypothetical protein